MTTRVFYAFSAAVAVMVAAAAGVLTGWFLPHHPPPPRAGMAEAATLGIRERLAYTGLHAVYLNANAVNGDTVNLTVRVKETATPAFQVKATLAYGWHVVLVEPFN